MIRDEDTQRVRIEDEDTAPVPSVRAPGRPSSGPRPAGERSRDRGERDQRAQRAHRDQRGYPAERDPGHSRAAHGSPPERAASRTLSADADARARYREFRAAHPGAVQTPPPLPHQGGQPAPRNRATLPPEPRAPLPALDAPPRTRDSRDSRGPRGSSGPAPRRDTCERDPRRGGGDWDGDASDAPRRWTDRFRSRRPRGGDARDEWDEEPRHWTDRFRARRSRSSDEWDDEPRPRTERGRDRRTRAEDDWDGEASDVADRSAQSRRGPRRYDRPTRDDEADDAAYTDDEDETRDQTGSGHRLSTLRRRGRHNKALLTPAMRARRRKRRLITWAAVAALILVAIPVINSPVGAWGADALRATLGPRLTAQVESYYFGFTDAVTRLKAHVFGEPKNAPWAVAKGTPLPTNQGTPSPGRKGLPLIMPLPPIAPVISPALPGEGQWVSDGLPGPSLQIWPIPMAKSFVRPDPDRPYAVVMLVALDLRQAQIHLVDGTTDPVAGGSGDIPAADQSATTLLAAFNGGFKASDGGFGLMTDGHTYLPAVNNAATLAMYADGTVRMGAWGTPAIPTANLIAYRQNGDMLIENGQINQSVYTDGYAWGAPILANIYTWRSAIAMTSSGVLIYAAGNAVTAETMAKALAAAGAQQAMELDINPVWVRFNTYSLVNGTLVANKLRTDMYGTNTQYLVPYTRDFVYITRVMPPDWPTSDPHVTRQGG